MVITDIPILSSPQFRLRAPRKATSRGRLDAVTKW